MFKTIISLLCELAKAIKSIYTYKQYKLNIEQEKNKELKKASDNLKDVCNNGTLDDLLDATKKIGDCK